MICIIGLKPNWAGHKDNIIFDKPRPEQGLHVGQIFECRHNRYTAPWLQAMKQGIGDGCQTEHYAYQNSQLHGNQDQDPEE